MRKKNTIYKIIKKSSSINNNNKKKRSVHVHNAVENQEKKKLKPKRNLYSHEHGKKRT